MRYMQYLKMAQLPLLALNYVKTNVPPDYVGNAEKPGDADRGLGRVFKWRTLEYAFNEAKATRKPVFIIIHKPSCPACQRLKEKFSRSFRLLNLSERFVMVNVENGVKMGKQDKYQPDGKYVPRILFFTSDGELIQDAYNRSPCVDPEYRYFYNSPAQIVETMAFVLKSREK